MHDDHVDTVRAIYTAFVAGDLSAILERLAPEVAWEAWQDNHAQRAAVPWLLPRRGRDGAEEFFRALASLEVRDFRVLSLLSGDGQVAAEVMIEAMVRQTGKRFRDEELHLWTFDGDGRVVRMRHYVDTAKQIAAADR